MRQLQAQHEPVRRHLPAGTVTFLFTDIEGSTKLLYALGAADYAQALAEHRRILREAFIAHGGVEVDTQGDAFFVAFPTAQGAVRAAAEALEGSTIELEGHELVLVDTGYTDTALSTSLHVPSIDLVVAGDVAYNGVHPYMAEGNPQTWPKWIAALDKLESLKSRAVIAGHKRPENDDHPRIIEETRSYFRDFLRLNEETTTVRELFDRMMELHGDRANPGSLWGGATAAKAHHSP